jgi:hypothetical protein
LSALKASVVWVQAGTFCWTTWPAWSIQQKIDATQHYQNPSACHWWNWLTNFYSES